MEDKIIMIFGGSGSLGNKLIETYLPKNKVINYSRDENKHWLMELKFQTSNLANIIGDIRDNDKVQQSILRTNPHIIIVAAALKHIDRCENEINECLDTNVKGLQNVMRTVEICHLNLTNLKTICFISTDKACNPINVYGISKALCEMIMIERSKYISHIKFVTVRYGNVLNSRGSIIPLLTDQGTNPKCQEFILTHPKMTRFIMTLDECTRLIEFAILEGKSGEIIIPKLSSMNIRDLIELFAEKYQKMVRITSTRIGERMYETLINDTQSRRTIQGPLYYRLQPSYDPKIENEEVFEYNSKQNILTKEELRAYLKKNDFL